jgi:hypothetical protein
MTPAYCGTCGTGLSETARFCPACGSPQATVAGYAPAPAARQLSAVEIGAAVVAIVAGMAMCFIVLYAIIYLPLHRYDDSVNYGESLRLGDIVALASGLVAIAIGILLLTRRGGSLIPLGIGLIVAGAPTLVMALLWAFPETFHLTIYPVPFYFAYVYFTDLGVTHIGDGYVALPLVIACASLIAAGSAILSLAASRPARPVGLR